MRRVAIGALLITAALMLASCSRPKYKKDGVYEGSSQSIYTSEPFFGAAKIEIKQGKIARIDFKIMDKTDNEIFDADFGDKHYAGNAIYMDQCKHDWQGVLTYPKKLLATQDLERVDAVTGATWSYNIFKDSVALALEKAK